MLTSVDIKFISDSACLSASLGDIRLFRCANILQIADVVCRVVFFAILALFLANSSPISYSWNEWNAPPFCSHNHKNSTRSRSSQLTAQQPGNFAALLTPFFTYRKIPPNLDMMNYAWDFSQSEMEKYFESTMIIFNNSNDVVMTSFIVTEGSGTIPKHGSAILNQ